MAVFEQVGGTSGGSYASHFTGRLTVTEESYSVADNTSYVYYKLELISGSSGRFSTYGANYSVTLNGSVVNNGSGTYNSQSYNTAQTICSGYTTIAHNADGTKNLSCSAVLDFASGTYSPGDFYPSGSFNLTTIPRASSVTATDANIGSVSTVNINRASSSFTHTLTYSFSNLSGTIASSTSSTSIGWTVPTSFFQKIPNGQSGTVTITCYTYSGGTHVGTKTTTMTVTVPTSGTYNSTPTITSATAVDTNSTTIALTGNSSRLVMYKSNVKLSATGQCKNYAGLRTFREMSIYDLTTTTSSSSGTTTVQGERTYTGFNRDYLRLNLVDTRGLVSADKLLNQANGSFTIVPYIPLTINATVERVSPTSDSAYLSFSGNFYNGYFDASSQNFNSLTIKWRYKEETGNWITTGADDTTNGWRNLTLNTDFKYGSGNTYYSGNGNAQDNISIADLFNYQKQYVIEIYYADELSSYTVSKDLSKGIPVHDEGIDSNGNNYFNINGEVYRNNTEKIRPQIEACFENNSNENRGPWTYIPFETTRYNNSNGKIAVNSNGTFKINYTGYIKVSFCIWIHGNTDIRPWLKLMNYTTNVCYANVIDDISSGYITYSLANCIMPVTSGDDIGVHVVLNTGIQYQVDSGSGELKSYITIELL